MEVNNGNFPIADLSEEIVKKIQTFENELKEEDTEEFILIAYQKERN